MYVCMYRERETEKKVTGQAKFFSITYRLFKLPGLLETLCEDFGQVCVVCMYMFGYVYVCVCVLIMYIHICQVLLDHIQAVQAAWLAGDFVRDYGQVYIYTYIYICVCVCMYVCMYIHVCVYIYTCVNKIAPSSSRSHTSCSSCLAIYTYIRIYIHNTHTDVHSAHAYIYT